MTARGQAYSDFWKRTVQNTGKTRFQRVHQAGSHVRFIHSDGRKTVVPVHGNEDLNIWLLKEILKQTKISREEYEKLRQKG